MRRLETLCTSRTSREEEGRPVTKPISEDGYRVGGKGGIGGSGGFVGYKLGQNVHSKAKK